MLNSRIRKVVAIEGPDGSGKSTLAGDLCERLSSLGVQVVKVDYRNTADGRAAYELAKGASDEMTRRYLMFAAAEQAAKVAREAKARGALVLFDRYHPISDCAYFLASRAAMSRESLSRWRTLRTSQPWPKPDLVLLKTERLRPPEHELEAREVDEMYADEMFVSRASGCGRVVTLPRGLGRPEAVDYSFEALVSNGVLSWH